MALFENLTEEARPYVLKKQRDKAFRGTQSQFWLLPMNAREFQAFSDLRAEKDSERRLASEDRSANVSEVDEGKLRQKLQKASSIYKDGDVVEGADGIGAMVRKLDWSELQELIVASANRSVLEEGAKNS